MIHPYKKSDFYLLLSCGKKKMTEEIWHSAKSLGFSQYEVSNMGRCKNVRDNRMIQKLPLEVYYTYPMWELYNDDNETKLVFCRELIKKLFDES